MNIGPHYVALANNGGPADTDGDGVPDYFENGHGDGNYSAHTDTETDWQQAQTITGTPDALNPIYDDVDLSGDGLVGRFKKALNMTPFDSSNPLTLTQVITGGEPDIVTFKVPINYDFLTNIADIQLWLDSGPGPTLQGCYKDTTDNSTLLVWNTTFDSPGYHYLQPRLCLTTGNFNAAHPIAVGMGNLLPFHTDNALQFDEFYSDFDSSGATLYAETYPGTQYSIELLDGNGNHLNTITGETWSYEINEPWDLTCDDVGHTPYTGDAFTAVLTVTPYSSPPQTHKLLLSKVPLGFGDGAFTIAYSLDATALCGKTGSQMKPLERCIQLSVVNPLIQQSEAEGYPWVFPHPYDSTFNVDSVSATSQNPTKAGYIRYNENDVTALLANLSSAQSPVTRNVYFYGQGSGHQLGGDSDLNITPRQIGTALGNYCEVTQFPGETFPYPIIIHHLEHPYRFAFLDVCHTGDDSAFADAFGIRSKISYNAVATHHEKAQALLGWRNEVTGIHESPGCDSYQLTLLAFFTSWQWGNSLRDCTDACSKWDSLWDILHNVLGVEYPPDLKIPLGQPQGATPNLGTHPSAPGSATVIFGYEWITRTGIFMPGQ